MTTDLASVLLAVPNHSAGSTPTWVTIIAVLFILTVGIYVVNKRKR